MNKGIKRTRRLFMAATVFCMVFAAVYEYFSHQVYSNYMIFAFAIPLLLGVLPYFAMGFIYNAYRPGQVARSFYNSGVITLMTGSIYAGILEIYGTTNKLLMVYPIAGVGLIVAGIIAYFVLDVPIAERKSERSLMA